MRRINRISRQLLPVEIMTNVKQLENVEYFNCLGSPITSDGNLHTKSNPGLPRQKQEDSSPENWAKEFKKGTNLHLEHSFLMLKLGHFEK
jgi:hypothetical protein